MTPSILALMRVVEKTRYPCDSRDFAVNNDVYSSGLPTRPAVMTVGLLFWQWTGLAFVLRLSRAARQCPPYRASLGGWPVRDSSAYYQAS